MHGLSHVYDVDILIMWEFLYKCGNPWIAVPALLLFMVGSCPWLSHVTASIHHITPVPSQMSHQEKFQELLSNVFV